MSDLNINKSLISYGITVNIIYSYYIIKIDLKKSKPISSNTSIHKSIHTFIQTQTHKNTLLMNMMKKGN